MSRKQQLLDAEDAAWRALCERVDRIGRDDWERPGAMGDWSPRDMLAHIACWHSEAVQQFERFRMTGEKVWWPDIETFNRESHERCADMTLHDVRAMSGAARHRFREEVAQLPEPDEKWARWIRGCGDEHYAEHIPALDAFLKERA